MREQGTVNTTNHLRPQLTDAPQFEPEPDWSPIVMPDARTGNTSFVEGDSDGDRIRLRLFVREADRRLFARVWFGRHAEGPPHHAHGGSVAAVLDHCMGISCWVAGHPVVAASITINFHHSVPLRLVTLVEAWVERAEGRKIYCAGRIHHPGEEHAFSTSTGLFIAQPMERFRGFLDAEHARELRGG